MKPFYCRQGSKRKYAEALESLFPPHQTYVEAFLGGGAVFWSKTPSHKEVINDFDSVLIKDYRNLVSAPSDPSSFPVLSSERSQNAFLANPPKTKSAKVVEALLRRCNGFGGTYLETDGVYKTTTHERKFENIAEYKDRLKGVTILNESYEKVFRKYDSNETFFFLDPPYEMSKGLDYAKGSESFDFEALERACSRLKGKFLITINDSPYIRDLFSDSYIYPYVVEGHHSKESSIGAKDRPELLISNYPLPTGWKKEMTGGGVETYKDKFNIKYGFPKGTSHTVAEIAKLTGFKKAGLDVILEKGKGAFYSNPQSVRPNVKSADQWAMARLYASVFPDSKSARVDAKQLKRGGALVGGSRLTEWQEFMRRGAAVGLRTGGNARIWNIMESLLNQLEQHPGVVFMSEVRFDDIENYFSNSRLDTFDNIKAQELLNEMNEWLMKHTILTEDFFEAYELADPEPLPEASDEPTE